MNRALALLFLTISLFLGLSNQQSFAFSSLDGGGPIVLGVNKLFVLPGDIVTFTVVLDGPASGEDELTISSTPGAFLNLPTTVTAPAGATSVTFSAIAGLSIVSGVMVTVSDGDVIIPAPTLMFLTNLPSGP